MLNATVEALASTCLTPVHPLEKDMVDAYRKGMAIMEFKNNHMLDGIVEMVAKTDPLVKAVWQHYQVPNATPVPVTEVEYFWRKVNEFMGDIKKGGNDDNRSN